MFVCFQVTRTQYGDSLPKGQGSGPENRQPENRRGVGDPEAKNTVRSSSFPGRIPTDIIGALLVSLIKNFLIV
jgi:hypothetical protein